MRADTDTQGPTATERPSPVYAPPSTVAPAGACMLLYVHARHFKLHMPRLLQVAHVAGEPAMSVSVLSSSTVTAQARRVLGNRTGVHQGAWHLYGSMAKC